MLNTSNLEQAITGIRTNMVPAPLNNIHAGTQVVAKIEVRGSQGACVHPRGVVGIVTRTPCGHEYHFLVRFLDNSLVGLDRGDTLMIRASGSKA